MIQAEPFVEQSQGEFCFTTCGSHAGVKFVTEAESAAAFDALVAKCGLFISAKPAIEKDCGELWGFPLQPRLGTNLQKLRIDRILAPTETLIDAGWNQGYIGIELKKSDVKIGPVVAQALDYSRAAFKITHGRIVMLDQIFIWPFRGAAGDIESVMTQHRIGAVYESWGGGISFKLGNNVIQWSPALGLETCKPTNVGRRTGSR